MALNDNPQDIARDLGLEIDDATPLHPFEANLPEPVRERDAEQDGLFRDWQINRTLPGANHPELKKILIDFGKVRDISEQERNELKKRIQEFRAIDRNHASMVGNLRNRFQSALREPYLFPRSLTDDDLRMFLELHKTAREISETVRETAEGSIRPSTGPDGPNTVPSESERLKAIKKVSGKFNLPTALTTFFSGVSVNHYDQMVKSYEREVERRNLEENDQQAP